MFLKHILTIILVASTSAFSINNSQYNISFNKSNNNREDIHTIQHNEESTGCSRRTVMKQIIGSAIGITSTTCYPPLAANAMYENAPVFESKPVALPSGVRYQDLRTGDGDVVKEGQRVNIQWALKRSNGYSIDSSAQNDGVPFIFVVGRSDATKDNTSSTGKMTNAGPTMRAIVGLDEGIRGMRVGGVRRIVFPPSLAYVEGVEDGKPGPVPLGFGPKQRVRRVMNMEKDDIPGESFILDVKATRVQ